MAKKKQTEPVEEESDDTEQIRLPVTFVRKARMAAAGLGMSLPKYIVERLGPLVDVELPQVVEALGLSKPPKPGGQ